MKVTTGKKLIFVVFSCLLLAHLICCHGLDSEKQFRMQKLNLLWEKASKKLPREKMKTLYTDLKYQDKEEIALKKLKAEGLDKDGMKEALVRGSFKAILEKYDMQTEFEALKDSTTNRRDENELETGYVKAVFKDKKLNKLWLKAEKQGFSDDQLKTLKEEFQHHQDKIDQYYRLMEKLDGSTLFKDDPSNNLGVLDAVEGEKRWKSERSPHQLLKEKHSALKEGYDYLNSQVIPNMKNLEFEEPQVNSLWEMAKNASFSQDELQSLRGELHHFEHRIRKLKHLTEQELGGDSHQNMVESDLLKRQKRIKEYSYKVEKVHKELAERITLKHTEL